MQNKCNFIMDKFYKRKFSKLDEIHGKGDTAKKLLKL